MTIYAVIRKSDQAEVYRYAAEAPVEPPLPRPWITKFAFRSRFHQAEKIAIEIASLDDPAAPIVNVAAPNVSVTNDVQPAEVTVNLPDRETTSVIERDREGNIVNVTQVEKTLQ